MSSLFHVVLYQPIFNLFVFLYNIVPGHDLGLVILLITILIRLALLPLTKAQINAQQSAKVLQPKIDAAKKQFANDKQAQSQAIMEIYKQHKVNPASGCLPILVQLPILIALYYVLQDGLVSANLQATLYAFVHNPGKINTVSLTLFDLAHPNVVLAVLAGVAQFWQAKLMMGKNTTVPKIPGAEDESMMNIMNKQMLYMMPVLTAIIGMRLPAGLTLYWFFGTVLMALQQIFLSKKTADNQPPAIPSSQPPVIEGQIVG